MLFIGISFMVIGTVLILCGVFRRIAEDYGDADDELPDIKPVGLDTPWDEFVR